MVTLLFGMVLEKEGKWWDFEKWPLGLGERISQRPLILNCNCCEISWISQIYDGNWENWWNSTWLFTENREITIFLILVGFCESPLLLSKNAMENPLGFPLVWREIFEFSILENSPWKFAIFPNFPGDFPGNSWLLWFSRWSSRFPCLVKNSKIPEIHEKITEKLAIRNPFYFSKKIHKKSHKYKL